MFNIFITLFYWFASMSNIWYDLYKFIQLLLLLFDFKAVSVLVVCMKTVLFFVITNYTIHILVMYTFLWGQFKAELES